MFDTAPLIGEWVSNYTLAALSGGGVALVLWFFGFGIHSVIKIFRTVTQ